MSKKQRNSKTLSKEIILQIEYYLGLDNDLNYICRLFNLKIDTVKKAITQGRIIIPSTTISTETSSLTKSERSVIDNNQSIGKACENQIERVLATKTGKSCEIKFADQVDLQNAGVLLAIPSLLSHGLLKYEKSFSLKNVYYSTKSIFLTLSLLILLRVKTLSGVDSLPSGELGRALGLDRIPEVKTLRNRIAEFSKIANITKWGLDLSKDWMEESPDLSATLYLDGHIKLYYGKNKPPPKRFVSRMRLSLSGTTDYWVNDALGQPFFVINKTISQGLISMIKKEFLDQFIQDVPNQPSEDELLKNKQKHRVMLVFDREQTSLN